MPQNNLPQATMPSADSKLPASAGQAVVSNIIKGSRFTKGNIEYKIVNCSGNKYEVRVIRIKKKTLKSITIPDTVKYKNKIFKVTQIGGRFAAKCKKLRTINIKAKNLKIVAKTLFDGIGDKCIVRVPTKRIKKYKLLKQSWENRKKI